MKEILLVGLGGCLGALARYGLSKLLQPANPHPFFSAGTLTANVLGCMLMGFLVVLFAQDMEEGYREALVAFILTGFLGSLTTFSTFILEFFKLSQTPGVKLAFSHLAAHLCTGLFGLWAGHALGQKIFGLPNFQ